MFKKIESSRTILVHTMGSDLASDTSTQKSLWPKEQRVRNLMHLLEICEAAGIPAKENLAALGFDQSNCSVREIVQPDADLFTNKADGNVLLTEKNVAMITWGADCCLVALIGDDGNVVSVLHASVNTLKRGIIDVATTAMRSKGVKHITAYVGVCAGPCCYEYGAEKAAEDFAQWPEYIIPSDKPNKVYLDLGIFPQGTCNICARNDD